MKKIALVISVLIFASLGCNFLTPVDNSTDDTNQQSTQQQAVDFDSKILFSDDFSDPNSGWDQVVENNKITDYDNGGYRMWSAEVSYDIWANPYQYFTDPVSVEVDATKIGGPDDNDFGIICNYQDLNNFHVGLISSDGFAVIAKLEDQSWTYLSSDNMLPVDGINLGASTNHIRFDCNNGNLTLYANGNLVASTYDDTFSGGDVGLQVGNFESSGVDILFDNFVVKEP